MKLENRVVAEGSVGFDSGNMQRIMYRFGVELWTKPDTLSIRLVTQIKQDGTRL